MGQIQQILAMPEDQRNAVISQLTDKDKARLLHHWPFWARDNQLAPEGDWTYWLILAGRGFGKTRCGAEWVRDLVTRKLAGRIGLIAPTAADARDTMVEGESGLLNIFPASERPHYEPSKRQITFHTGAIGKLYSAEEPERLRGPQHDALWCFVAGTMVSIEGGQVPVQLIKIGDKVLTRKGLKKVISTANRKMPVGTVAFSNGTSLTGTAEHPIWANDDWINMSTLKEGDVLSRMENSAVSVVSTWVQDGSQTVYNLQIEETPEYYANGILTHNCDELCAWKYAEMAWDMAMFGLRLGTQPRACITTTPKPTILLKSIMNNPHTHVTKGRTHDNLMNLAPTFKEAILSKYEGTRLGRQELYAEVLEDVEGALWSRDMIQHVSVLPSGLQRIVVAVDPPVTSGANADECGIVVVGLAEDETIYVIDDKSSQGDTPQAWAQKAVKAYYHYEADCMVAEVNNGGDLVELIIRQIEGGQNVSYKDVRATRGKFIRAEPVAAIYEQGRVYHCGQLTALEDQMCSFTIDIDRRAMGSPDRVDALVWGITELIGLSEAEPNMRWM